MSRRYLVAAAVIAALSLIGCSSAANPAAPSIPDQLKQKLLAAPDPAHAAADRADYYRQKNDIMATCMAAAGFDYVPYTPPAAPRDSLGLSEAEFVKRYGFGISTLIDAKVSAPARDPNAAIADGLTPGSRHAYDEANNRCQQKVFMQVGAPADGVAVVPADLSAGFSDAADKAEADARVVAARQVYATCMTGAGFAGTAESITNDIGVRAAPFVGAYRAKLAAAGEPATVTLAEALTPTQLTALSQLQRFELAAAAADYRCGQALYPLVEQVHREYLATYLNGS